MMAMVTRIIADLIGRLTGPLTFRIVLQPAMAIAAATKAGIDDARRGRPAFLWAVFSDRSHRRELLKDGWKDVVKIFVVAVLMDLIYQWIALGWIYPGEALIVAFLLAGLPYVLVRGLVNRIARLWLQRERGAS